MKINTSELKGEALNWAVTQALTDPNAKALPPLSSFGGKKLPYDFDLLYDIKYYHEVESVINGVDHKHCSEASAEDLIELAHSHGYSIDCDQSRLPKNYAGDWTLAGPIIDKYNLRPEAYADNTTFLEAAMHLLVTNKLGNEVDVPSQYLTSSKGHKL